jgi:hypothetical protein
MRLLFRSGTKYCVDCFYLFQNTLELSPPPSVFFSSVSSVPTFHHGLFFFASLATFLSRSSPHTSVSIARQRAVCCRGRWWLCRSNLWWRRQRRQRRWRGGSLAGNVVILDVVDSWFWRHVFVSSRHDGPTRPTCRRHHVMSGSFFLCRMTCRYLIADMYYSS